jgi:hypothetical protein
MPSFDDDLNVGGNIRTGGGTVTFHQPEAGAWFHIQNRLAGLCVSHGVNPGDSELVSVLRGGEVHGGGAGGGFSFADRDIGTLVESPQNGERWVWYAVRGKARLWSGGDKLVVTSTGDVGIGTTKPRARLEVNGDIITTGDVVLQNEDCAEDFDVAAPEAVEPGTVMVLDDDGRLEPSSLPYDRRVAGVVSGGRDLKPGLILGRRGGRPGRQPVALIGKVYCRADAGPAPIRVGDLLTTAGSPGCAMRALDPVRAFGAVIGKALRPLPSGQNLIPILVALQ